MQFKEYLERAEYIKKCMDGKQEVQHTAGNGEGPTQKSRPNGGGGGGKDDVSSPPSSLSSLNQTSDAPSYHSFGRMAVQYLHSRERIC